jgi:hypothetical protein
MWGSRRAQLDGLESLYSWKGLHVTPAAARGGRLLLLTIPGESLATSEARGEAAGAGRESRR